MLITSNELKSIVVAVAMEHFGINIFSRRELMNAVERKVRKRGLWTNEDDFISESAGIKSKGLAKIDWCISALKKDGYLLNVGRDQWQLPK